MDSSFETIIEKDDYTIRILYGADIADPRDNNVDVFVEFRNGKTYVATFFTLKNIQAIMDRYKTSGECKSGLYFYCTDMIIVNKITDKAVSDVIQGMIDEQDFESAFQLCVPAE